MQFLYESYLREFLTFTLVLARFSGLVFTAPVFGTRDIPMVARAMLAFTLSMLVFPVVYGTPVEHPQNIFNYALFVGAEVLIGLVLGMGVSILFMGVEVAGRLIGQVSGMSMANVLDPSIGESVPVHSRLLHFVTLGVFVTMGGHRQLIKALLESFDQIPPGAASVPQGAVDLLTLLVSQSFVLGIRAAAPVVMAVMLSTLVLGLIGRTLPQLNILVVGFGVNSMITLLLLSAAVSVIALLFQGHVETAIGQIIAMFERTSDLSLP